MFSERKAYIERMEAQLAEWSAQIASYRAKAKRSDASQRADFEVIIEELQHWREEAAAHVQRLKATETSAWEAMKQETEILWAEIKTLFQRATTRF